MRATCEIPNSKRVKCDLTPLSARVVSDCFRYFGCLLFDSDVL